MEMFHLIDSAKEMRYFLLINFIFLCCLGQAQSAPALEKIISLHLDASRLDDALEAIANKASAKISYNASLIDESKTVQLHIQQQPVREALSIALGHGYVYKQRGQTIIIQKAPLEKKMIVSGYVRGPDGKPLPNATVFDKASLVSSTTNTFGYYEMRIEPKGVPVQLQVSKFDYRDTLIALAPMGNTLMNAVIAEDAKDTTLAHLAHTVRDSTKAYYAAFKDFLFTDHAEIVNVNDTIYRRFQFSFLPFVGTNRRMSGNVINDVSLNVIGGYNRGVRQFELGALANLNRGDVEHAQVAGFANANGGNTRGVQAAGFGNFVRGNMSGVQAAGHTNIVIGNTDGVQLAGFANFNKGSLKGVQASGFSNINIGRTDGVQASGFANLNVAPSEAAMYAAFANVCTDSVKGIQVAGFANVAARNCKGPQLAGFTNVAGANIRGLQLAGFANIAAGEMHGVQIAGFANIAAKDQAGIQIGTFNYARKAKVQIGCFNVADSLRGVPIGLFSYVRHGYHKVELSNDDQFDINVAVRTGVPALYNILLAGLNAKPVNDSVHWTFGYGLGSAPRLSKRWRLNLDLTAQQIVPGNVRSEWNLLNKLTVGAEWQFARKLSLAGGVTLNGYIYEPRTYPILSEANAVTALNTYNLGGDVRMKTWIGWKIALRFF